MKKIGLFIALAIAGALAFAAVKWYNNKAEIKENQEATQSSSNELSQNPESAQTLQEPSGFNFRFLDEGTGLAVVPEKVEIKKKGETNPSIQISKEQVTEGGTASIKLSNGAYDVTVKAQGYEPMTSNFQLDNQTLDVNFNLVSLNPTKELSSEYIQSFHRLDAMVIVGFIADNATGKPLDNVKVYSKDKKVETQSKTNGFFQLIVPLAENENVVEDRGTLFFEKNSYKTEVRQNFDMYPNGDIIIPIRMNKGTGANTIDILQTRKANREISK